ncbi:hypothetical protein PAHAL_7G168300 [Panicum hallii]|uniref:Uncharacterized protein n=1 Tax=Panicum hallii TaxID=206008 RepID=A0A2S3I7U4_9POAL|nr:uncharacterized protein LOC112899874 [Panicum hallii]PAN38384.1 hypothetical protein PAHAL_7G168300 [Panicum hallii]
MERAEPSLKPEWLLRPAAVAVTALRPATSPRADDQGRGASSRNRSSGRDRDRSSQQSSSRRSSGSGGSRRNDRDGTGKSRGYSSFGRHNRERVQEKDPDFRDRDSKLVQPEDPLRDGFESFSSCRSEKDRLNRTRSKVSVSNRAVGVSLDNGNISKKDTGGISFEREFPHLGSEDKNGKQDIGRVPSPGISTPIQNIPLITASEGWNSVLAEVPTLSDPSINSISSSLSPAGSSKQTEVSNSGSVLSMAETVMQSPLKISTTPQLSIDAQKIEERTLRQCILRPLTPSTNKISNTVHASNSLDKLKSKGSRAGESNGPIKVAPQLSLQPSSCSIRTPVKTELVKPSQSGSFQVLSREQNGTVNTAAKDSTSNPVSPVLGRSSSMEPMRKSVVNPKPKVGTNGRSLHPLQVQVQGSFGDRKTSAKDKLKFFEFLRSKSVNGSSTAIESSPSLIDDQQNSCLDLSFKFIENGSSSCEEANSCEGSQQHLSDNEEIIPTSESHDVLDEGSLGIEVDDRDANSSPVLADTEDVASKKPQADKAEDVLPVKPAYINDSSMISNSVDSEANLLLEEAHPAHEYEHIGAGEEKPCPAQEFEPIGAGGEEELNLLRSMGWDENEVVQPLQQEEIADCLRQNVRLQQKLQECRG